MAVFNPEKCDPNLGQEINDFLVSKSVETPMNQLDFTQDEQLSEIEERFKEIMEILGMDLTDDSLEKTPHRVAKMYVKEIFGGLNYDNFPKVMSVENKLNSHNMVLCKDITLNSCCEHHFVPFIGTARVAYIPGERIIGLSKINRIVQFFCSRPQIQERLLEQIYWALYFILGTENIAVKLEAEHLCVKMRGVEDYNSSTVTTKLGGLFFLVDSTKQEFLNG